VLYKRQTQEDAEGDTGVSKISSQSRENNLKTGLILLSALVLDLINYN
jgi:hypothetical protein